MNKCDVCKKEDARIHIVELGDFCIDCYNRMNLELIDREDTFDYSKSLTVIEPSGKERTFKIEHMIIGSLISWEAREVDGDYHFQMSSSIDDNGAAEAQKFFRKIVSGVCNKTIDLDGISKNRGIIRIVGRNPNKMFSVDGRILSADELAELFEPYEGFNIVYQIQDASYELPGENDYLVPVHITGKSIISELKKLIEVHGNNGFIDYNHTFVFSDAFIPVIKKLELFYRFEPRETVLDTAKEMVRILKEVETDDDWFPQHEMEMICMTVDPFCTCDELWDMVQGDILE